MARIDHTDDDLVLAMKQLRQYGSQSEAARQLGIPYATFKSRINAARTRGLTADTQLERTKDQEIKALKKQVSMLQRDEDTAESVRRVIYELADIDVNPPRWLRAKGAPGRRGTPMTIWSDWHWGETVRKEEVGGVNEFNKEIAEARVKRLVERTIDLAFHHMGRAKTEYPGIIVCLGGDMISGDIHEELSETNWAPPQVCVRELKAILIQSLTALADAFGRVYVPCVVGNHGRTTRKPRAKNRVFLSYEWNLYTGLEDHFKAIDDKRIQFFVPGETDAHFQVYNHRFLLTHGDNLGVRGGDGIIGALGPIMRGALKTSRSESQIGRDFDTIVIGHWHQYITLPGLIVNNALKGYDEYARLYLRAPASRPSQALWFVHPEHGITAHWQVYLEPDFRAKKKAVWVSVLK